MSRLPYSAKRLIEQVQAEKPKATYETTDDPDGFNVHRSIKFDKRTSKWLAPLMDQFADMDPRIAEYDVTDAGYLHVRFVGGPQADNHEPFPIQAAATILRDEPAPVHTVNDEDSQEDDGSSGAAE